MSIISNFPTLSNTVKLQKITLPSAGWAGGSPYTQTIAADGVRTDNAIMLSPAPASWRMAWEAGVYCSAQSEGKLTFTCKTKPGATLSYNVLTAGTTSINTSTGVTLTVEPYTGNAEITAIFNGTEYNAANISQSAIDAPNGTLIIKQMEG